MGWGEEVWNDAPQKVCFPDLFLVKREPMSKEFVCADPQSQAILMEIVTILRNCLVGIVVNSGGSVKMPGIIVHSKVYFPEPVHSRGLILRTDPHPNNLKASS